MVISNPCLFFLTQKNENFPGFFGRLSESFPELQTCVDKAWAPPRAVFTAPGESPGFQGLAVNGPSAGHYFQRLLGNARSVYLLDALFFIVD